MKSLDEVRILSHWEISSSWSEISSFLWVSYPFLSATKQFEKEQRSTSSNFFPPHLEHEMWFKYDFSQNFPGENRRLAKSRLLCVKTYEDLNLFRKCTKVQCVIEDGLIDIPS